MARRTSGFNLLEFATLLVFLLIFLAFLIPGVVLKWKEKRQRERGAACLVALMRAADGATGGACPASDRAVAPRTVDGGVSVECPDPEAHLQPAATVRRSGGTLSILQPLPAFTAAADATLSGSDARIRLEPRGSVLAMTLSGKWWQRWLAAPVFTLVAVFFAVLCGVGVKKCLSGENTKEGLGCSLFLLIFTLAMAGAGLAAMGKSVTLEIDGAQRTVKRTTFLFGIALGSGQVHTDVAAIAAVKARSNFALVALAGDAANRRSVDLVMVPEETLGLATRLRDALAGKR